MDQTVSSLRCASYDRDVVRDAIRRLLDPLGGMARFVQSGQRVLIKPNLLTATHPDRAVTTHPVVIETVSDLVIECGGRPIVADSPVASVSDTRSGLKRLYGATGLLDLNQAGRLELAWDLSPVSRANPNGKLVKRLDLIRPVTEADVVIALPKLKTHALTTFTGGTKILFGTAPGISKLGYHAAYADPDQFGDLLIDILEAVSPSLMIMDGVLAMEGNGPGSHGTPRHLGVLLASADAVALDLVACQIVGIDPNLVPPLRAARRRDLWPTGDGVPQVVGTPVAQLRVSDFRLPDTGRRANYGQRAMVPYAPAFARRLISDALSPLPTPSPDRCTGCGGCVTGCPVQAIRLQPRQGSGKLAIVDKGKCIHCYCCHELCPEAAIDLRISLVGRFLRRLSESRPDQAIGQ